MADDGNASSRKRVAGREISKDNPDPDEDSPEPEMGSFLRASDEVMATRRIIRVRKNQPRSDSDMPSNPFSGLNLVTSSGANAKVSEGNGKESKGESSIDVKQEEAGEEREVTAGRENLGERVEVATEEKEADKVEVSGEEENVVGERKEVATETGEDKDKKGSGEERGNVVGEEGGKIEGEKAETGKKEESKPAPLFSSFQHLSSSQNAFSGLAGTGFSTTSFTFGSDTTSTSLFGAVPTKNGNSSTSVTGLTAGATETNKVTMQEVHVETGEENENAVFTADAILYEYLDGGWKERGKGELKLNLTTTGEHKARLVMRARGNYRLILNASLYADMALKDMDKRGVTFVCVNGIGEGQSGLSTFAIKFKDGSIRDDFSAAVEAHKGKNASQD